MRKKIGVLLVNLGTPDSPSTSDVRSYLTEFLTDGRVIDIPWLPRQLLVRGFISPFRSRSSAKLYKEVWSEERGSPLMYYGERLQEKVQASLSKEDADYRVVLAMRYKNPSIEEGLKVLQDWKADELIVFPLFPQYASATTGSIHQKVMEIVGKWWEIPEMRLVNSFPIKEEMIKIFAANGSAKVVADYDHVLMSFHGLPESQLKKADTDAHCLQAENCCQSLNDKNKWCYSAQCHATAQALAKELGLRDDQYTLCFQSRLGTDPWLKPYTSEVLKDMAAAGHKKLLCFCPAFVADCLETVYEVSVEYQEDFEALGGERIDLVESLNDSDEWAQTVVEMIKG